MVGLVVTDVVVVRVVVVGVEVCDVVTEVVVVPLVCVNVCVWCLCNEKGLFECQHCVLLCTYCNQRSESERCFEHFDVDMHMQFCSVAANNVKS